MPLTQNDRLKGAENSITERRKRQQERRAKVKAMFDNGNGMSKSAIARELNVSYKTIATDLQDE